MNNSVNCKYCGESGTSCKKPSNVKCERCGADPCKPCIMMKCNGFCSASVCDDNPHDHELEVATVHQARLRS